MQEEEEGAGREDGYEGAGVGIPWVWVWGGEIVGGFDGDGGGEEEEDGGEEMGVGRYGRGLCEGIGVCRRSLWVVVSCGIGVNNGGWGKDGNGIICGY